MTDNDLLENKLLAALPRDVFAELRNLATIGSLRQGEVLCEPGDEVDNIYFPLSGMISLVVIMSNGRPVETAAVGREGVYGAMAGLGIHVSHIRSIVRLPAQAAGISAPAFRRLVARHESVRDLCIRYNETLLSQAYIAAASNALHAVENRFCRWLLQTSDGAQSDVVTTTQDFLSQMLGVRRTTVTEVAGKLQEASVISYLRGRITILDRGRLKAMTCECYETLRERAPF